MSVAYLTIPRDPDFRFQAFETGLRKAGFKIRDHHPNDATSEDIVVQWNLQGRNYSSGKLLRQRGGKSYVCENPYFGKEILGEQYYAISLNGHNGSGVPVRIRSSFPKLPTPSRWRDSGDHVLICDQRGIGSPDMRSPSFFGDEMFKKLSKRGNLKLKLRKHPGISKSDTSLDEDMVNCSSLVVWSSNCATHALISGYPVHYCAPHIITQKACLRFKDDTDFRCPLMDDDLRQSAFIDIMNAQWNMEEISSGELFS